MLDQLISVLPLAAIWSLPVCLVIYICLAWTYGYWRRRGIFYIKPSFLYGNIKDVVSLKETEIGPIDDLYRKMKDRKYGGMFYLWKPVLIVKDPELVKKILITDFNIFINHPEMSDMSSTDRIIWSLFTMRDQLWKERRAGFSTVFTPKKLRSLFPGMVENSMDIIPELDKVADKMGDVDMEFIGQRVVINVLTSTLMGLKTNVIKDSKSVFVEYGKCITTPSVWTVLKSFLYILMPSVYKLFKLQTFPPCVWNFFDKLVADVVDEIEKNSIKGGVLFQTLIEMKNKEESGVTKMTVKEMVGHIYSFFEAGFDTSAITLSLCLHELSRNQDAQEKLRQEVDEMYERNNGELTFEGIQDMTYIDQVLSETLRMYPPAGVLKRENNAPYSLDENVTIEKGTHFYIPLHSLHHDPNYFPDPDVFDPNRFSSGQPHPVYMPFGKGPRMCIGMKFAELELKVVLCLLMRRYVFKSSLKTPNPVKFDPNTVIVTCRPKGGAWVKIKHRDVVTPRYY